MTYTERHRETQRDTERHRETQRDTERQRETQRPETDQTRPDQTETRPDQTRPDQTRPDQTRPDQTRPDQTRPDQTRPDQTRPDQTRPDQTRPDQTRPAPWLRLADHGEDEPFFFALSNLSQAACHSTAKWLFGLAHSFSNGLRCAACHPVRLRRSCSGVASKGFVWSQWWRNQGCVAKVCCMCCLPAQYLE